MTPAAESRSVCSLPIPQFKSIIYRDSGIVLAKVLDDNIAVQLVWIFIFIPSTAVLIRPFDVEVAATFVG